MHEIKTVAIIGGGTMGSSIANVFLNCHIRVNLIDVCESMLETAKQKIKFYLESNLSNSEETYNCLKTFRDMEKGMAGADLVLEAIPEDLSLKQEIFKKLDNMCPASVILATNTSGYPITSIAKVTNHKERVVGTHFFTPAESIPIVEVIKSTYTSKGVVEITCNFLKSVNKKPLIVNKDVPGFVANRMQHALVREAISLVQNGIASVKDVDLAVKYIFGVRFPSTGILEQRDLSGLDVNLKVAEYLYADLEDSKVPMRLHEEKVKQGHVGLKTGKGFYEWSNCRKEEIIDRKNKQMMRVLAIIEEFEKEV